MNTHLYRRPASVAVLVASSILLAEIPVFADSPGWAARDSAENREIVAKRFLNELVLDGSIRSSQVLATAKLVQDGKNSEAFENYIGYFEGRLRYPGPSGMGPALEDEEGAGGKPPEREAVLAAADKLLKNQANFGGKDIDLGEPGLVDWSTPWETADNPRPSTPPLHCTVTFLPLADAYFLTGDRKYLDKWTAFMDDWAMNDDYFRKVNPVMVPDGINSNSVPGLKGFLKVLGRLPAPAAGQSQVPSRVVAAVLEKFLYEVLPCHLTYIRSNTHNWTPSPAFLRVAKIFEDFKVAPLYLREGRRRYIEDQAATQNLRDGSENQQDHWYNTQFLRDGQALDILEADSLMPGWRELKGDIDWKGELREHLKERITFLIHDRSPQNQLPLAWNGGYQRVPEKGDYTTSPEAFEERTNRAILMALEQPGSGVRPDYTSDWFPYGGFNIARDGWEPNDGYASMFCSPQPGAYGGYRSRSNNNTFCFNAYGQDLLIDDSLGHYMYPSSPITVDGKNQFFHAGIYKVPGVSAHKVFQVNAWWTPANWRWLSSSNFNLMEGVYAGPWANPGDETKVNSLHGVDDSMAGTMPLEATLRGVTHQRLALYVRGEKFWIITDRMLSAAPHRYVQSWLIPIRPQGLAFDPAKISLDADAKKVMTNEPTVGDKEPVKKVNLSLYQFTPAAMEYTNKVVPRKEEYGRILNYGWDRVMTSWQGTGDSQVVTVLFPRAPGTGPEGDLKSIKQITGGQAGYGFEAVTPDGSAVAYLASTVKGDKLALGKVAIQGEALLVSGEHGVALGCSQFGVNGQNVALPGTDVEFDFSGGQAKFTPIYRPIDPVTIGPDRNVFSDSVQVTLSSKTPGVQFRYTLDGSDPTPNSSLYSGPFTVNQSVEVKARAYRPGVTANPSDTSGTVATPVSLAVFDKRAATPPVQRPRPLPGLVVNYYEGTWNQLLMNFDDLKPVATGKALSLWDTSLIPASNPAVGAGATPRAKAYALEYSGFLNVPADGVYTLRAPDEFVWPATEAGYDLRIWLGNRMGSGLFAGRVVGPNQWYPSTRIHAFGNWSVALQKGLQPFRVVFIDYRGDSAKKLNFPGIKDYVWTGASPNLKISGPGLEGEQPIPDGWLLRPMEK